jgi:hypothetical protein
MANRLTMAEIDAMLTLHTTRRSQRAISRLLEVDRGTVGKYVAQAGSQNRPNAPPGTEAGEGSGPVPLGDLAGKNPASGPPSECEPFRDQILDRFRQHAEVLSFSGKSYRLWKQREASGAADEPSNAVIAPTGSDAIDAPPSNRSGRKNRKPELNVTC